MHSVDTRIYSPLRPTDRKRLLAVLSGLASPDATKRAKAAIDASEMLAAKGVSWPSLIPQGAPAAATEAPEDWKQKARQLLQHDGITAAETTTLKKLLGWRAPGTEGLSRLREIAARVSASDLSF